MASATAITIDPGHLSLAHLRRVWQARVPLTLASDSRVAIEASAAAVQRIVARGDAAYGINTGFGRLAKTRIPDDRLQQLQRNLIFSHSVGTGELLRDEVVRLALAMKIGSLARGYSGVRPVIVDTLLALYNADIMPCIPAKGSVGASGDLAPLAHLTLALMGEGDVRVDGALVPARQALDAARIAPVVLGAKEGLALINGTQISNALALHGLFLAERLFESAVVTGALSVDAAKGSDAPFDPRLHELRGQPGQIAAAHMYRELLAGSAIRASHLVHDDRVQDPYSLRCQPQVMGACRDLMAQAARTLLIEANAVTDNPLIFSQSDEVISGGNFHGEPVALAADTLALALAEIGALSERRIALLIDSTLSGLPPFLVREPGINSGFMIAHVTAAAVASENKSLAHPASVDSLPTSANQEDHVSMSTFAARRLHEMAMNTATIIGIELLAAAQGIDFHRPLETSPRLRRVHRVVREKIAFYEVDRILAPDIEASRVRWRPQRAVQRFVRADGSMMPAIDMSVWQGRIDAAEGSLAPRWHQAIRPLARDTNAGTVVLIGFACDAGVARNQGRTGAAGGPAVIRHMLRNMPVHECDRLADAGDIVCAGDELEAAQIELSRCVAAQLAAGRFPIVLGGGHEMAFGTFVGLATHFASEQNAPRIGIVNFDAHFDLRHAERANSGTPFLQIAHDCEVRGWPFRYGCFGVSRYSNTRALFERAQKLGVVFVLDEQMQSAQHALAAFVAGVDHVYLTFCLDVLPAAIAPGVSAPAVRGIGLDIVEPLIDLVIDSRKLRLADIAEMNPRFDIDHQTAAVAARIVARIANGVARGLG